MSEISAPTASWPGLLALHALKDLYEIDPEAAKRLIVQIEEDARHLRRMSWARLIAAIFLFSSALAVTALLVLRDALPYGAVTTCAGVIPVVTILLAGRPQAPRRK